MSSQQVPQRPQQMIPQNVLFKNYRQQQVQGPPPNVTSTQIVSIQKIIVILYIVVEFKFA